MGPSPVPAVPDEERSPGGGRASPPGHLAPAGRARLPADRGAARYPLPACSESREQARRAALSTGRSLLGEAPRHGRRQPSARGPRKRQRPHPQVASPFYLHAKHHHEARHGARTRASGLRRARPVGGGSWGGRGAPASERCAQLHRRARSGSSADPTPSSSETAVRCSLCGPSRPRVTPQPHGPPRAVPRYGRSNVRAITALHQPTPPGTRPVIRNES